MFVLSCNIQINTQSGQTVSYRYVNEVVIDASLLQFTDRATVSVPQKLRYRGKDIAHYIKPGDQITINLGYDDRLHSVFTGFIRQIKSGTPVELECENQAYALKRVKVSPKLYPTLQLKSFTDEYMPDFDVKTVDVNLGEVRIEEEISLTRAFDYLAENYPLQFFFKDGVFYAGLATALMVDDMKEVKLQKGVNMIRDDIKVVSAADVPVQIVAKSILPDNTELEHKEPSSADNAEIRTYYVPGAKTAEELKVFAGEKLNAFSLDRMEGKITCFGEPYMRKGDVIHLLNEDDAELHDKKMLVNAVRYRFGRNGYRQEIQLGRQL